jgi:hypothetical protein
MRILVLLTNRGVPCRWTTWMGNATPATVTCAVGDEPLAADRALITETYHDGARVYLPVCSAHAAERDLDKLDKEIAPRESIFMGWMSLGWSGPAITEPAP